jgi:hypothetical protein
MLAPGRCRGNTDTYTDPYSGGNTNADANPHSYT